MIHPDDILCITFVYNDSKDVRLPVQLQRAMAAEAEAAREARAKVIAAEGEQKASHALKEAASVIQESPSALQVPLFVLIFLLMRCCICNTSQQQTSKGLKAHFHGFS